MHISQTFSKIVLRFIQSLPLGVVTRIGQMVGRFAWWLDVGHRRVALRNVGIAFDGERSSTEQTEIARAAFLRLVENVLVAAWTASRSDSELKEIFEITGVQENLMPAHAKKRGVIHVLFHFGNWECLSRSIAFIPGVKFSTVYQPLRNPFFNRLIAEWRGRSGLELINRRNGMVEAVTRLRKGEAVGVLVDQHAGDHGMWIPFFGRLASTTTLPALLARRTGATIIPIFCFDVSSNLKSKHQSPVLSPQSSHPLRFRVDFAPPIPSTGCSEGEIMVAIHARLEEVIRKDPAGWFWLHDRWKTPSPNFLLRSYRRGVYVPPGGKLKPFRILVRGTNWLGDSILTIPALRAIRQGRPDCHLTLLVPPKLARLWEGESYVDEVISSITEARRKQFDAAILFPNSLRAAWEAWILGVPRRQGYAGHFRSWLLTSVCPENCRAGVREHDVKDFCGLARWSGAKIECEVPMLDMNPGSGTQSSVLSPSAFAEATADKQSPVLHSQSSYVVLHPGAAHGSAKRWLPDRFVDLVRRFPDLRWKLIGSMDECDRNLGLAAEMSSHGGRVENDTGRLDLNELARVLRGATAVVCNDSGPMHLTAAVGTRVVAIFGSTEPIHTAPLGDGHRVIRQVVECSPCYLRKCPIDLRCMKGVTVDEVESALKEVLTKA